MSRRHLAERIAASAAPFICLHGVDEGDAFALATQFACGWAYRGGEALLWRGAFRVQHVYDRYLPAPPTRPLERRGVLEVVGTWNDAPLALVAARFARDRFAMREWRAVRAMLRRACARAILFADAASERVARIGVADLGFTVRAPWPNAIFVREATG
ncbi:MAG: hypothetical protein KGN02_13630 [bacterium]|nr:hypothetical protein [bacterium]